MKDEIEKRANSRKGGNNASGHLVHLEYLQRDPWVRGIWSLNQKHLLQDKFAIMLFNESYSFVLIISLKYIHLSKKSSLYLTSIDIMKFFNISSWGIFFYVS